MILRRTLKDERCMRSNRGWQWYGAFSSSCIYFDVNIGENLEKRIVVFWFDRSQSSDLSAVHSKKIRSYGKTGSGARV